MAEVKPAKKKLGYGLQLRILTHLITYTRFGRVIFENVEERGKGLNRINYDEELWKDILQHTDLIRRNKNACKFQGFEILTKSSRACGKEVLCSMGNDTATSKEV
ncbi:hypothetical protein RO3G_08474 [Rhizopus delemar RA 99-880]|uniref:Uncharacterized protein n=1 Tax=Rhizopus delemar (strain RA 99-880 / ATCC MYA-4621 / FGSC 9543 / NRRL 43880) TaxID=246409 RepID=I1C5N9_RHIO9|nr:hypothetical protein RO3G_08474 [Rhizopus delemar RA 99-880]|eukprot:EIE83769.1 hypothetical protein RO3G_08474 [Rhizopus delemar RA 99-880]